MFHLGYDDGPRREVRVVRVVRNVRMSQHPIAIPNLPNVAGRILHWLASRLASLALNGPEGQKGSGIAG